MGRVATVYRRVTGTRPVQWWVATTTLGLSLALAACVFAVVDAVVLRAVPGDEPQRVVAIAYGTAASPNRRVSLDTEGIADLAAHSDVFDVVGWSSVMDAPTIGDSTATLASAHASPEFFAVFGVAPSLGRLPSRESVTGQSSYVVLSERVLERLFGGIDPVGSRIRLGGDSFEVKAVMPASFNMPSPLIEAWVVEGDNGAFLGRTLAAVGRLRAGFDSATGLDRIRAIRPSAGRDPDDRLIYIPSSLRDQVAGPVSRLLPPLALAIVLVVLLAGATGAVALLIRSMEEEGDVRIHLSLGASALRVVMMSMRHVAWLVSGAIVVGWAAAYWTMSTIVAMAPIDLPRVNTIAFDGRTAVFLVVAAVCCGGLMAVGPFIRAYRIVSGARVSERAPLTVGALHLLNGVQVMAAVTVAVIAASMFLTVARLGGVKLGFDPDRVYGFLITTPRFDRTQEPAERFMQAVSAMPTIESVAVGGMLSVGRLRPFMTTVAASRPNGDWIPMARIEAQGVSPAYFSTLRIPIRRGTGLDQSAVWGAACRVVVNELFATIAWPQLDPIGRQVDLGVDPSGKRTQTARLCEVVGVAGDTRSDLLSPAMPQIYFSYKQRPGLVQALIVRARSDSAPDMTAIERHARNEGLIVRTIWSGAMEPLVRRALVTPRFYFTIALSIAVVGLALAVAGVSALTAYTLSLRRREIGIRLAVGAPPRAVGLLLVRGSVLIAVIAAIVGVALATATVGSLNARFGDVAMVGMSTATATAIGAASAVVGAAVIVARRTATIDLSALLRER